MRRGAAERGALGAVHADADEVGERLRAGAPGLSPAAWIASGEPTPKTVGMSIAGVLEDRVRRGDRAEVTACAGVRHPRSRRDLMPFSLIISGERSVCAGGGNGGPAGSKSGAVQ